MTTPKNARIVDIVGLLERRLHDRKPLERDLSVLCSMGGRRVGGAGARQAEKHILAELEKLPGTVARQPIAATEHVPTAADAALLHASDPVAFRCAGLPGAPGTDDPLEAVLLDLGRGVEADFTAAREQVAGRAVLVDHEYPFSSGHVHRRKKYAWANDLGAAAFIIANNTPGAGLVTGGVGRAKGEIPAVGIGFESARTLRRAAATDSTRIRLRVASELQHLTSCNIIYEQPGEVDEWVVICAHYDGHDLAESALDNASGTVAALQLARVFARQETGIRCGVRFVFFSLEEWGLQGSRYYFERLTEAERSRIRFVINLDVVSGDSRMCALTGGDRGVEELLQVANRHVEPVVEPVRPLLANSDHHVFQEHRRPAIRLVRGYERPQSEVRFILTEQDRKQRVDLQEIAETCVIAAVLAVSSCESEP